MQKLLRQRGSGCHDGLEIGNGVWSRKGTVGLTALLLVVALAGPVRAQSAGVCRTGRTALVLSGGGAKGLAHIGVIRALDSLGLRPDLVVGTSMGSIIGGLYASGYTGAQIDSITRAGPTDLFANRQPRTPRSWRPLVPLLTWEKGASGLALQSPAAREPDANATLSEIFLRGNLIARGDFDSLSIPFRAVATDLTNREPVVLGRGDLAQAIRASIAVPLVFSPERIDGRVLTDGGIAANVPVAIARALGATRVIVSDVSGRLLNADELADPLKVADQLVSFLFAQSLDSIGPGDTYIKHDVEGFSTLDFSREALDSLRAGGRRTADSALATLNCLPRASHASRTLPTVYGPFRVEGLSRTDAQVLQRLLGVERGERVNTALLGERILALRDLDAYRSIWLHPVSAGGNTVAFQARVTPMPGRRAGATFAYDHDLSGRLGAAYLDQSLFGSAAEWYTTAGFGSLKTDATLGMRRYYGLGRSRLAPAISARYVTEKIPLYRDGEEIGRPRTHSGEFFVGLERDIGPDAIIQAGFDGRLWKDADTTTSSNPNLTGYSGGVVLRAIHYPGSTYALAEFVWSGTFHRLQGEVTQDFRTGSVTLTPRVRVGWGELMPLQYTFPLGGDEGFPGLAIYERRGDRDVLFALQGAVALSGPVSLRVQLAAGRSATGGPLVDSENWVGGVRAGAGVDTPLGPVRFEYGFATSGGRNLYLRIGRWF
jgi:NTE family protein